MTKNVLSLILPVVLFSSCNTQLDKINQNPNASTDPSPAYLLTGVEKQGADLYWGSENNFGSTLLFSQQWAAIQYTDVDRYNVSNTSFITLWDTGYSDLITVLNTIMEMSDADANPNYKGVALTLRSWVFLLQTDAYGDIPYSEACKNVSPVYDAQKNVYKGLLNDLVKAQSQLDASAENIEGDIVYNGSIAKWKKFANSLRLRIALRIADREPDLAKQTIAAVVSDPAGLINDKKDIFQFVYIQSPQQNPAARSFETRDDYRISKTMVDKLYALNDPRLPVFAQMPSDTTVHQYVGVPNGLSTSDANALGLAKTSRPGTYFLSSTSPAVIFSQAEVLFGLSEAVARGYISGNAEQLYREAITASFNQFGITDIATIENYLNQASVKYDPTNYKKSIGEQKWIAFFGQGMDAFAEWRRLDYPELKPSKASVLNGAMPLRLFYPGTEQSLNSVNYKAAIADQGADLLTTRLWFDVK